MLNIRETSQKQGLRGNTSCAYARECLFQDSPRPESALQPLYDSARLPLCRAAPHKGGGQAWELPTHTQPPNGAPQEVREVSHAFVLRWTSLLTHTGKVSWRTMPTFTYDCFQNSVNWHVSRPWRWGSKLWGARVHQRVRSSISDEKPVRVAMGKTCWSKSWGNKKAQRTARWEEPGTKSTITVPAQEA